VNSHEAKEVLLLYRPGTEDRDDPEIAAALDLARREPELAHWLEEHCKFQEAMRGRFNEIPVPEGLKEQILSERPVQPQRHFPRRAVLVSAVVAAVTLVGGVWFLRRPLPEDNNFSSLQKWTPSLVLRGYPDMDLSTSDLAQIRSRLAKDGLADYKLPKPLQQQTTATGCKVLAWHEQKLSMICFNSGRNARPGQPDLYLFIIDQAAVRQAPATASPTFTQLTRHFTTASWSLGGKTYVLGANGDEAFLKKYL
jgi:hypothetical protein